MTRSIPLCLAFVAGLSAQAAAETVVFNTAALTTSGVFGCLKEPVCSSSGSSVTLGTGDAAVTLTFTGVDTTVVMSNEAVPVTLGTLTASSNSPTFPTRTNPDLPIVLFALTLTHSSPVDASMTRGLFLGRGGGTTLPLMIGLSYFQLDPGPVPPGYQRMVYSFTLPPIPTNGSVDITAEAGVAPEPATMVLVASGLVAAVARRGRKRREQNPSAPE